MSGRDQTRTGRQSIHLHSQPDNLPRLFVLNISPLTHIYTHIYSNIYSHIYTLIYTSIYTNIYKLFIYKISR